MADKDKAREDIAEGLVAYAANFRRRAKDGEAGAADVGAALKLLKAFGGEMDTEDEAVVQSRDEGMESLKDLDFENLH